MKKPIEICKWGYKPKSYCFSIVGKTYVCDFGGATVMLPLPMQAILFHDLLLQAGYTPEPNSVAFKTLDIQTQ